MIRGVLLDVDGTLVLSNDAHAESWVRAFEKFGYDADYKHVRRLIGMGGDKLVKAVNDSLDKESGDGKKISEYRKDLFEKEYVAKLQPAPGSRALVKKLRYEDYKIVVASSASSQEIDNLLKAADVHDLIPHMTTADDAKESKPDPDIVVAALEKIGLPPEEVIMIGDTPYDIEAAGRANVGVIAVLCGGWKEPDLAEAIAIYKDPADLCVNFEKSTIKKQ